jgi:hypothetical protein
MSQGHTCLSQLAVERYLLGETSPTEQTLIDEAIASCESCATAVAETRADNEAFAFRPVPDEIRKLWTEPQPTVRWPRILAVAVPLAAAAALAAVLVLPGTPGGGLDEGVIPGIGQRSDPDLTTPKGFDAGLEPSLGFYVLRDGQSELGRPGEGLAEGDRIQFWYDVPTSAVGVVVGIDGRGAVTRYVPESGSAAATLHPGKGHVIESSVVLDDAVGVERFFLCAGERAGVDPAAVERAAKDLASSGADLEKTTRLPIDCKQASVWIRKE